jgi:hypothetical protein
MARLSPNVDVKFFQQDCEVLFAHIQGLDDDTKCPYNRGFKYFLWVIQRRA